MAGRVIGIVFAALALLAAGGELVGSLEAGGWRPLALGLLWYRIDPGSLNLLQAGIERHVSPTLWDPVLVTLLQAPTWLVLGLISALLLYLFRRRQPKRWFRR